MEKEMEGGMREGEGCDCACHRMGGMGMSGMKGECFGHQCMGHGYHMRVWKMLLMFAVLVFVFWIGLVCGEFRATWEFQGRALNMMPYGYESGMLRDQYANDYYQSAGNAGALPAGMMRGSTSTQQKSW